jgi:cell division protease FtsH
MKILEAHTRAMPLAGDVDLGALASSTPGMVGADLANLANEAALRAARREHDTVTMADFTDSLEKILLGAPRGIILSAQDRERTAYHESGHALVGMLTPGADPVRKVSIIPRGQALGVTLSTPDSDRVSYSREDLEAKIDVSLGGRVAEEVVYGQITTGAESDIQQLTNIARQMVGRWGMSDKLGPVTLLPTERQGPLLPGASETSPQTQWLVDQEVELLVQQAHANVTQLLSEHRDQLESLAHALLAAETLDASDAYAAAGVEMRMVEPEPQVAAA